MSYCEDYPCCGHTPQDPCERQPYDEPGYYDTTVRGQEHRLCDHENGECNVEYDEEDYECEEFNVVRQGMCKATLDDRGDCPDQLEHGDEFTDVRSLDISDRWYPR